MPKRIEGPKIEGRDPEKKGKLANHHNPKDSCFMKVFFIKFLKTWSHLRNKRTPSSLTICRKPRKLSVALPHSKAKNKRNENHFISVVGFTLKMIFLD